MINNIRFTSNEIYGIKPEIQEPIKLQKEGEENVFEEIVNESASKTETQNNNQFKFYALGAPAGFFMDNSLLEAMEAGENLSQQQNQGFNPYLLQD